VLVAAHLGLLAISDLADHLFGFLALSCLAFVALWFIQRRLRGRGPGLPILLLVAALLRLSLLPLPPTLSNDSLRYLWDGRVIAAGQNPYLLAPEAEELSSLRDELWRRMDHRDVPTVYPPFAMALFSLAAVLPLSVAGQLLALKFLLSCVDLGACLGLVYLARRFEVPENRVLWYAWNPLVVLEVAGMGHVDTLGVAAVVATLYFMPKRTLLSAWGAVAAIHAKLIPVLMIPMWSLQSGRARVFLPAVALLSLAAAMPLLVATGGIPPGLVKFGVSWEFNGPLFEPLWRLLAMLKTDAMVAGWLDQLKEATDFHPVWNHLYPLLLALGLAAAALRSLGSKCPLAGTGWLFGMLLLCSATVYPWYLLWALPWAALCRQPAWLALSVLLPLSYLPQFTTIPLFPWVFGVIWIPFGILLLRYPRWSVA